jgi:hypothetical protein
MLLRYELGSRNKIFFMNEIWKPILGYEWLYEVSNLWKVKSLKYRWTNNEKLLKLTASSVWYYMIRLCKNKIWINTNVHRIVAENFLINLELKRTVNHKNWIKTDNRVENLEWCTHKENTRHAFSLWLQKWMFWKNNPNFWKFWKDHNRSKSVIQFTREWEFIREWWSISECSLHLWISRTLIINCCKTRRHISSWSTFVYKV